VTIRHLLVRHPGVVDRFGRPSPGALPHRRPLLSEDRGDDCRVAMRPHDVWSLPGAFREDRTSRVLPVVRRSVSCRPRCLVGHRVVSHVVRRPAGRPSGAGCLAAANRCVPPTPTDPGLGVRPGLPVLLPRCSECLETARVPGAAQQVRASSFASTARPHARPQGDLL